MIQNQVKCILRKNFTISYRNKEHFIELTLPIIISLLLVIQKSIGSLTNLLPIMFSLANSATIRSLVIITVEEKGKRFKEFHKIMGLGQSAFIISQFLTAYIKILLVNVVFVTSFWFFIEIFDFDWQEMFVLSFSKLMMAQMIFSFSSVNQALLVTSLVSDVKIAGEIVTFITVIIDFFSYVVFDEDIANFKAFFIFGSIISPTLCCTFIYMGALNPNGPILTRIFPSSVISTIYPYDEAIIMLIVMMVVYFVLYIYADQVVPNEFGVTKNPLFFLEYFKWGRRRKRGQSFHQQESISVLGGGGSVPFSDHSSAIYHESINNQDQRNPTVRIQELTKQFGSFKAVDSLTLYLYESEIFCLLGHNGAGKTTTISLLTGMYSKSSGSVTMYGLDLDRELVEIRKNMGLCTQRDILYQFLTVMEHLVLMSGIKGIPVQIHKLDHILSITELTSEKLKLVGELSGGSMRKLSLALTLIGDAQVIFLDEPTSGMDAHSRRAIWTILERIKLENKTIILTTHHLDEAEILADRIGIMAKGQLLAVGSSDYIKRKFGEGYSIKVRLDQEAEDHIKQGVKNGSIVLIDIQQLVKQDIEVTSDGSKKSTSNNYLEYIKTTGRVYALGILKQHIPEGALSEQQSNETMNYQIPFSAQRKLSKLFKQLEQIPGLQISMEMNTLEDAFVNIGHEEQRFLLEKEKEKEKEEEIKNKALTLQTRQSLELTTHQLNHSLINSLKNDHEQQSACNDIQAPDCLRQPPRFSFLNQTYAMFLRRMYGTIRVPTNYFVLALSFLTFTIGVWTTDHINLNVILKSQVAIQFVYLTILGSIVTMTFCFSSPMFVCQPVNERETKLKQCLQSIGCSRICYWAGTFLCDFMLYSTQISLFFLTCTIWHVECITENLLPILYLTLTFGLAFIFFSYLISNFFTSTEQALKVVGVFNYFVVYMCPTTLIGVLCQQLNTAPGSSLMDKLTDSLNHLNVADDGLIDNMIGQLDRFHKDQGTNILTTIIYIIEVITMLTSPFWNIVQGLSLVQNNYTKIQQVSNLAVPLYFQNYEPYCLFMIIQTCLFAFLLVILEIREQQNITSQINTAVDDKIDLNTEVHQEINRVIDPQCKDPIKSIYLDKQYEYGKTVLQQTTFGVKEGEIFAVIGPNSAGKSTLINILTDLIGANSGQVLLNNKISKSINRLNVGICPQFDCIWEYMTPLENLSTFGRIKGLSGENLQASLEYFIKTMQLDSYVKSMSGNLSGGNKRKLCVADALIGGSSLAFFDEPSTGVDPVARRFLFATLKRQIQLRNSSMVMTTHTIEEAEVLCDRLGILVRGKFMALGTPEELRKKYTSGYTVSVKLDNIKQKQEFKEQIQAKFDQLVFIEDKRELFVTFAYKEINFSFFKTYEFFDTLITNDIIQDFSITETSLESIFLFFTRQQASEE